MRVMVVRLSTARLGRCDHKVWCGLLKTGTAGVRDRSNRRRIEISSARRSYKDGRSQCGGAGQKGSLLIRHEHVLKTTHRRKYRKAAFSAMTAGRAFGWRARPGPPPLIFGDGQIQMALQLEFSEPVY